MNISTKLVAGALSIALLAGYSVAYAETGNGPKPPPPGAPQHGPGGPRPALRYGMGSTTEPREGRPGMMGSTSRPGGDDGRPGMRLGSTTEHMQPPMMRGIPGMVTEVSSDHFLMNTRGFKEGATTTLTVKVTSATVFRNGSTTGGSLADLSAGSKVVVMGKVATSTKTVSAERVMYGAGDGKGPLPPRMNDDHGKMPAGVINKLKELFSSRAGDRASTAGGPAAAGANDDFVGGFMQMLLGWMHV